MYDVIVIGSGGSGLSAALAAAVGGARVIVLEASSRWGGSTSVSGGQVWTPANHRMAELGVVDNVQEALRYCLPYSQGRHPGLIEAFVDAAPQMAHFVEANSAIVWRAMGSPDTFAEHPGGRSSARHLEVSPVTAGDLAPLEEDFWMSNYPSIFTNDEVFNLGLIFGGEFPAELAEARMNAGQICAGIGLIVGLMQASLDRGVKFERNTRARQLVRDNNGHVSGVTIERDGHIDTIFASRGVILATGGFEWDLALRDASLSGAVTHPVSPPLHHGDGLRMAASVGAALAHTSESWCWPAQASPGQFWPGTDTPRHNLVLSERCMPHVIWVNEQGNRFVNESSHNCALAFSDLNAQSNLPSNLPAWAIVDSQYRARYPFAGAMPDAGLPEHVIEAQSLDALAQTANIEGTALIKTIKRYNEMVSVGRDDDYQRGESAYDRFYGDPGAPHPNLGTIEQAPFFAMPIQPGAVGTKGGVATNEHARVLDWQSKPIGGLWAAGNAMASIIGPGTIAPGLTLGLALTWGYIAGTDAVSDAP